MFESLIKTLKCSATAHFNQLDQAYSNKPRFYPDYWFFNLQDRLYEELIQSSELVHEERAEHREERLSHC